MGKLQRQSAREKMLRGEIAIRIGKKVRTRDRKLAEKRQAIFMPVPKGTTPLSKEELDHAFGGARDAKSRGATSQVDLNEEELPPMPEEDVAFMTSLISHGGGRPRFLKDRG
jgi:hypothetical protein